MALCGAGAIGSNLADNLARHGAADLRVIDRERVEGHNISTQLYGAADVGVWKVEALRNHLFSACGVEIQGIRKELAAANARALLKDCDLVVDAFDNTPSRQCVQDFARATSVACLHVGLHEDYCEVIWDEQYRVPRDDIAHRNRCDYPLARNIVALAAVMASEAILRWVQGGVRISRSATLRDLAVRPIDDGVDDQNGR